MKKVMLIKNLDCANCANKIERKVSKLKNVENVIVNFMKQTIEFELVGEEEAIINDIRELVKNVNKSFLLTEIE